MHSSRGVKCAGRVTGVAAVAFLFSRLMAAVRWRTSCRCAAMVLAWPAVAIRIAAIGGGRMLVGCGAACLA
eukprot:12907611-Prorocentrum_lima.AAC.1